MKAPSTPTRSPRRSLVAFGVSAVLAVSAATALVTVGRAAIEEADDRARAATQLVAVVPSPPK